MAATELRPNLKGVEIGALDAAEIGEAAGVLARAMRDNPTLVAALRRDPARRQEALAHLFGNAATALGWTGQTLVARCADGSIVGLCRIVPPGACRPSPRHLLRLLPGVLRLGPRSVERVLRWRVAWAKRDPTERHWHFGPLAVDAHLQGMGIGSRLMRVACAQMDAAGDDAYLETDKAINVAFCERFGFAVIGMEEVLGVPNWYMCRRAAR